MMVNKIRVWRKLGGERKADFCHHIRGFKFLKVVGVRVLQGSLRIFQEIDSVKKRLALAVIHLHKHLTLANNDREVGLNRCQNTNSLWSGITQRMPDLVLEE